MPGLWIFQHSSQPFPMFFGPVQICMASQNLGTKTILNKCSKILKQHKNKSNLVAFDSKIFYPQKYFSSNSLDAFLVLATSVDGVIIVKSLLPVSLLVGFSILHNHTIWFWVPSKCTWSYPFSNYLYVDVGLVFKNARAALKSSCLVFRL